MPSAKKEINTPVWVWPLLPAAQTRVDVHTGDQPLRKKVYSLDGGNITLVRLYLAGQWRLVFVTATANNVWTDDCDPYGNLHRRMAAHFQMSSAANVELETAATRALKARESLYQRYTVAADKLGKAAHRVLGDHHPFVLVHSLEQLDVRRLAAQWQWWWGVGGDAWLAVSEIDGGVWRITPNVTRRLSSQLQPEMLAYEPPATDLFANLVQPPHQVCRMVETIDCGLIDLIEVESPHLWHAGRDLQWSGIINLAATGRALARRLGLLGHRAHPRVCVGVDLDNALPVLPESTGMKEAYRLMLARLNRLGQRFNSTTIIFDRNQRRDDVRVNYLRQLASGLPHVFVEHAGDPRYRFVSVERFRQLAGDSERMLVIC